MKNKISKRIVAVVLSLTLLVSGLPVYAEAAGGTKESSTSREKAEGAVETPFHMGYVPVKKKAYNKTDLRKDISRKSTRGSSIPASYDAREDGSLPAVRDQGYTESCWAFAVLGSAESGIMKKNLEISPDLSERQLAYGTYNKWLDPLNLTEEDDITTEENGYALGGNDYFATCALARWQGAVNETDAPFDAIYEGDTDDWLSDSLMYQQDSYHLENSEFVYFSTPNRVKEMILEKGAGSIGIHAPASNEENQRYFNDDMTAYYCDEEKQSNHAVLVVGWDDNYAVSNFNESCQPSKPGAWLIRNSWGESYHDGGYFWISYEDAVINSEISEAVFYDVEPAAQYDNNYQYDGGLDVKYTGNFSSMANVFTAQYRESLEAVSFWTAERGVSYEIKVYQISDEEKPDSGTRLGDTITGTAQERGYHTIDFTENDGEDIPLEKGDKFSIVVRLTSEAGGNSYLPLETESLFKGVQNTVSAGAKESFIYDGESWRDCQKQYNANVCLKAFTSVDNSVLCEGITSEKSGITVRSNEKTKIQYQLAPADVTNEMVRWESADESIARVSGGVVYGVSEGTTTVTGTINGYELSVSVTVEEKPIESISLPETITINRNQSQRLSPDILPQDTTDVVTWSSSDTSKVIVDAEGVMYGIAVTGTEEVVVEASSPDGKTAQCRVTVVAKNPLDVTLDEMQSFHPYFCQTSQTFEFERENAIGYRVTFSEDTSFEEGYDYLYVYDSSGIPSASYTGTELAGKTISVSGNRIQLKLKTDLYETAYGFRVTKIEPEYSSSVSKPASPAPVSVLPQASPAPAVTPKTSSVSKKIIKKLKFKPSVKKVKAGKTLKLSKYLKITKQRKANAKITYTFTKKKFKKYASLSKKGVLKIKKKAGNKTLYVKALARDGSGKSAVIKVKIIKPNR